MKMESIFYFIKDVLHIIYSKVIYFIINLSVKKEFWISGAIISAIVFIFIVARLIIKKRAILLSKEIKKEKKNNCKKEPLENLKKWLDQIYIPSLKSVLFVCAPLIILFILSLISKNNDFLPLLKTDNSDYHQTLISMHAGIGVIIFALLIFIAETLRGDTNTDRARVLLKESFLFPIAFAEVIVFMIFILSKKNIWSLIPIFIVSFSVLFSLYRLLSVLLSKAKFQQKRLKLLKDRINLIINIAINERIGNNILLNGLGENKIELHYNPFKDPKRDSDYCFFYAKKQGIIKNIRLDKLKSFATLIEREANTNGFSFYKHKRKPVATTSSTINQITESSDEFYNHCDDHFLINKYKDEIDEDNNTLLCIKKGVIKNKYVFDELARLSNECFIIGRDKKYSEEINHELAGFHDQFLESIIGNKSSKIDEYKKAYITLAESFLESLSKWGVIYTIKQARQEMGTLFGGSWNEIKWLKDSVRDLIIESIHTKNIAILSEISLIPFSILLRAIKSKNQYLFQEFLFFYHFFYVLSFKRENLKIKSDLIRLSYRNINDLSRFYIVNEIKKSENDISTLNIYEEFAIAIFFIYQNLLMTSVEKKDFDNFKHFVSQTVSAYKNYIKEYREYESFKYGVALETVKSEEDKKNLEQKINVEKKKVDIAERIIRLQQQLLFGVAAWILSKYLKDKENKDILFFFNEISNSLPVSIDGLTELYLSSRSFDSEDFWDWSKYERIANGEFHWIDFFSKLDTIYCVSCLRILSDKNKSYIDNINLPYNRDLVHLTERDGNLTKLLDKITANLSDWNTLLPNISEEQIHLFKQLLNKTKEEQEEEDVNLIINIKLSNNKVEEFENSFIDAFYKNATVRNVAYSGAKLPPNPFFSCHHSGRKVATF